MNPRDPLLLTYSGGGRNWLSRALVTTLGLAIGLVFAVAAFFFLTVALVVGTFLVAIIAARFWWVMRRVRAQRQASGPLEGDYTLVPDRDQRVRPSSVSNSPSDTPTKERW